MREERRVLREQRDLALLWRQLATISLDAPIDSIGPDHQRSSPDPDMLNALSDALRFGPMTRRRLQQAAGVSV